MAQQWRTGLFSEDLNRYPASAFVIDSLGLTPPGTGFHIHIVGSAPLPSASFRLRPNGPIVAVPTTLVKLSVSYQGSPDRSIDLRSWLGQVDDDD